MLFRRPNHCKHLTGKRQSGVAIITALLIVTIAATVSITISTQLQLDVRRTSNMIALDQANNYASFIEKFVQDLLQDKDNFDTFMTTLTTDGKVKQNYPVENGTVVGEITDLNSCININSLVSSSTPPAAVDPLVQSRLTRLFNKNQIPATMIPAIIDWIDADSNTTSAPNGAEDGHYLNLEQPYHTANRALTSITELRLIKGADNPQDSPTYKNYQTLSKLAEAFREGTDNWPSLCAFNTNPLSPPQINVNTASRDVLLSLSPDMTTGEVNAIIDCRGKSGGEFKNMSDFTSCGNVSTIIKGSDRDQLDVISNYFLLKTTVNVGDATNVTYSIIFRDAANGTTEIISRTQRTL